MTDYQLNDLVVLQKGNREGYIRYIGKTDFEEGIWYGVELKINYEGEHDGSVEGKQYFKCKQGQGIFVKKNQIKCRKTRSSIQNKLQSSTSMNDSLFAEKFDTKNRNRDEDNKPTRKAGPREIGKNSNWQPPEWDITKDQRNFLCERPAALTNSKIRQRDTSLESAKKQGPREIGRFNDWAPPDYKIKNDKNSFLKDRNTYIPGSSRWGRSDDSDQNDSIDEMDNLQNEENYEEERIKIEKKILQHED